MNTQDLLYALFSSVTQHIHLPDGLANVPLFATAAVGVFGLLLMIRGAKWASGLGAMAFLAVGALGGSHLAAAWNTPLWPTIGMTAVVSFVLGLVLFRIWQAVMLGGCCAAIALSVFYFNDLAPKAHEWIAPEGDQVTLQPAGTVVGQATQVATAQLQSLWTYLSQNVQNFEFNFWTLLIISAVAGLVFGLLLPRVSKSLWAATVGTFMLGLSVTGLLAQYAPAALAWLQSNTMTAWTIVGVAWVGSFAYNLLSSGEKRPRITVETNDNAKSRPAIA
jgi:hypothetical protein